MRKGRSSLVLISGTVLRGVLDCRSVVNRTTSRSQYGIKKIRNERSSVDEIVKTSKDMLHGLAKVIGDVK